MTDAHANNAMMEYDQGEENPQEGTGVASRLLADDVLYPSDLKILGLLQCELEKLTTLRNVVANGDVAEVERLLSKNSLCVDVPCYDDSSDSFCTLLGFVAARPNLPNGTELMKLLLAHGASVNALSNVGETPLFLACKCKNVPGASLLLASGARHDIIDHSGASALCAAASLPPKDSMDNEERHEASLLSVELIELLLWYQADRNGQCHPGAKVPLVVAIEHNNYIGVQTLLQAGASPSKGPTILAALSCAASESDVDITFMLMLLCSAGADPLFCDESGRLPVQIAYSLFGDRDERFRLLKQHLQDWEVLFGLDPIDLKALINEMKEEKQLYDELMAAEQQARELQAETGDEDGVIFPLQGSGSMNFAELSNKRAATSTAATAGGGGVAQTRTARATTRVVSNLLPERAGQAVRRLLPQKLLEKTKGGQLLSRIIGLDQTSTYLHHEPQYNTAVTHRGSTNTGLPEPHFLTELRNAINGLEKPCRDLLKDSWFQMLMLLTLLIALYFPDLFVVGDVSPVSTLDVLLYIVMALFLFEISVQCLATAGYPWSFFFWADTVGMLSVIPDFSFIMQMTYSTSEDGDATIILVTRMIKLAARAGRFFRLVKILKILPGMSSMLEAGAAGTARKISDRLHAAVSIRVSFVIIFMVILIPGLLVVTVRLAEQDLSLLVWPELVAKSAITSTHTKAAELASFFAKEEFFPYELERRWYWGTTRPEWDDLHYRENLVQFPEFESFGRDGESDPKRSSNVVVRASPAVVFEFNSTDWRSSNSTLGFYLPPPTDTSNMYSIVKVRYNFTYIHQLDSGMNMVMIALIMTLLVVFSLALQGVIKKIVLSPLEALLNQVRELAATMFKSVNDMSSVMKATGEEEEDDDMVPEEEDEDEDITNNDEKNPGQMMETALLGKIANKLTLLHDITMAKQMQDQVDEEIQQYTQAAIYKKPQRVVEDEEEEVRDEEFLRLQRVALMQAGLTLEDVESFEFNPLELDDFQTYTAVLWFLQGESMNLGPWIKDTLKVDGKQIQRFLEEISAKYVNTNPYHNWLHAVDVTHCTYSLLNLCKTRDILSVSDRFSMILAAVCHDVGHPGYNNPFLVESSDALALKYNDKSPLENMHCAIMFDAGFSNPETAIFDKCSKNTYIDIRRVAIDAILHTDMVNHFPMVSHLKLLYEENVEMISMVQQEYWGSVGGGLHGGFNYLGSSGTNAGGGGGKSSWELPQEAIDFWKQPEKASLLRNMILHAADISNPFKPFPICRAWA
ncbi:unnamed protein product [Amoebophrya sp. A25]|nr:unnamed protein product [Amoebophrya sp. A25]|eukprot:GSA25T00017274001.1